MKSVLAAAVLVLAAGCATGGERPLQVASGTIVVDTGLAEALADRFTAEEGPELAIRATGSGEAFALARRGDVDLILTHDPRGLAGLRREGLVVAEAAFARLPYVIVGPPDDPAGVGSTDLYAEGFARIAAEEASFVSRGDRSGTHARELALWRAAGVEPGGGWYASSGTGQVDTLRAASERAAYTLSDAATFALLGDGLALRVVADGDPDRFFDYDGVAVRGPRSGEAAAFVEFLRHPGTLRVIERFGDGMLFGAPGRD